MLPNSPTVCPIFLSKNILNVGALYRAILLYTSYKRDEDDSRFTELIQNLAERIANLEKLQAEEECRIKKDLFLEELNVLRPILHQLRVKMEEDLTEAKQGKRKPLPPPEMPQFMRKPIPELWSELKNPADAPKKITVEEPKSDDAIVRDLEMRKQLADKELQKNSLTIPKSVKELDIFVAKVESGIISEAELEEVIKNVKSRLEMKVLHNLFELLKPHFARSRSPSVEILSPEPRVTSPLAEKLLFWTNSPPALFGKDWSNNFGFSDQ